MLINNKLKKAFKVCRRPFREKMRKHINLKKLSRIFLFSRSPFPFFMAKMEPISFSLAIITSS